MSRTTLKRVLQVFTLVMVLSALLSLEAFAVSRLIKADEGGVINIAEGVSLIIPPNALEEDAVVHARVSIKKNQICYNFGPDDIVLNRPVKLVVSQQILEDAGVDDLNLYGEDGERIKPRTSKKEETVTYKIDHFSLYYHRRR